MTKRQKRFVPLLVAISIIIGIVVGSFFTSHFSNRSLNIINSSNNKINDLFHLINDEYVDTVNISELIEKSLPEILKLLDPHSTYIPQKKSQSELEILSGDFSGIGINLLSVNDTLRVINVSPGGPAEKSGIKKFDKIITINDSCVTNKHYSPTQLKDFFSGPINSILKLNIEHLLSNQIHHIDVIRAEMPQKSIDVYYTIEDNIGYIHIHNFGANTYSEFLAAIATLSKENPLQYLILDVRGNTGGYMRQAIQLANEFLPKDKLIVYTKGRKSPKKEFISDGRGAYQTLPLIVLIDEYSASASEIFAGAMQDNDRATIIGRRSFGKGLVQIPIQFRDGSMVKLTQSRYYTPTGRCVQKPYKDINIKKYDKEIENRYQNGEFFHKVDSSKLKGNKFTTPKGKIVYGGGGIMPDVFVQIDTTNETSYYQKALNEGYITNFAYYISTKYNTELSSLNTIDEIIAFITKKNIINKFPEYSAKHGLKRRNLMFYTSKNLFYREITAQIILIIMGTEKSIEFKNRSDLIISAALKII